MLPRRKRQAREHTTFLAHVTVLFVAYFSVLLLGKNTKLGKNNECSYSPTMLSKRIHNYDDNDLAELVTHICSIREAAIE